MCIRDRCNGADANIFVSFNVIDKKKELTPIIEDMNNNEHGYEVVDISDNELAKTHGRYLVGGKSSEEVANERLYSFEFPEKPGALFNFLQALKADWNITLFHYRNHGHDIGKVLCGFTLPEGTDDADFQSFLNELGYKFNVENDNVVYKKFLRSWLISALIEKENQKSWW